ncbi:hypothetical protein [Rhodococcus opacus]|uniref:hypothetical protein n=1 Tax=Rhodococcus opacus TaxID=37919 RepID=UPI0022361DA7|nr:hypothetical protein [Rhodococcus opacus]UZG60389.1 hypothetical protein ONE62_42805 [Rhodococcus opacus]
MILADCGEPVTGSDPADTVRVIRSELRLQALDFWLRNPDYLADELVTKVEVGEIDASYLSVARHLLDDPEPDLRWYPMPRWHFGAYEAIDDAFSLLEAYGLAALGRIGDVSNTVCSQFFLTEAGMRAAADLAGQPRLSWYTEQVKLVHLVAGNDLGSHLKQRQYRQAEYAGTELGVHIGPIVERVRERLDGLDSGAHSQGGSAILMGPPRTGDDK